MTSPCKMRSTNHDDRSTKLQSRHEFCSEARYVRERVFSRGSCRAVSQCFTGIGRPPHDQWRKDVDSTGQSPLPQAALLRWSTQPWPAPIARHTGMVASAVKHPNSHMCTSKHTYAPHKQEHTRPDRNHQGERPPRFTQAQEQRRPQRGSAGAFPAPTCLLCMHVTPTGRRRGKSVALRCTCVSLL